MKKIININLSGRVIPIEDTAYEKLKNYIESLRRYFAKEEDRDEIINDIESRIAELMSEKIRKGASCITDTDIDEIAASMGRPEDFAAAEAETATSSSAKGSAGGSSQQQSSSTSANKRSKRLYRDTNDKFLGGVCSGIATYLNIDPSIIRILFAIITFGGFGLGFIAYIVLWIILPEKDVEGYSGKRLYRNPEDRVAGGVAGGLAAYFNRETWVIRLIFLAPFIFSLFLASLRIFSWHNGINFYPNIVFGSLGSTFILTYIILWIVLPEARSTYEKMEMRGETVDVNTIRQNMKDRIKDWSEEVKERAETLSNKAREYANTTGKTTARDAGRAIRRGGSGIGHAIAVLFKAFFLFIAGTIAFAFFVALMALLFSGFVWWQPVNNFLWTSKWQQIYGWGTLIFFLIIPLIGFIVWLVRRMIKVRSHSSYLGWVFGFLWCIGWVAVILLITSLSRDFNVYDHTQQSTVPVSQPANGRMIVTVSQPELQYTGNFAWINDEGVGWDITSDTMKLAMVNFDISPSPDSLYHVAVLKYSFGRNAEDAIHRADNFDYTVTSTDSILDLASGYAIGSNDKFRGQKAQLVIQVPIGKKLRFDESVRDKLVPGSFKVRNGRRRSNIEVMFNDNNYFWWVPNVDYIMKDDGHLAKVSDYYKSINNDVKDSNNNNDYRYEKGPAKTNDDIQRQLDEEKRKREESDRKIRQLEEKQRNEHLPTGQKGNKDEKNEGSATNLLTVPVISPANMFI